MPGAGRILHPGLARKVVPVEAAAAMIGPGMTVGMSGFTGAGYPKEVPVALARRIADANASGAHFKISVWTGASTAPELDGALAAADGIELRLPYQSDPVSREKINSGHMEYIDVHLSHVAQMVWEGFLGHLDVALIEVSGITADGHLVPSSSVGNNKTWIEQADAVILEVNSWQSSDLDGMHDIYYGTALPPNRRPIPLVRPGDRIGEPYLRCPPEKVVAVVETDSPDRNTAFTAPDEASRKIAGHLIEFLEHEVARGRLPADLLPVQSGVGNVANAALAELAQSRFENLTAFTEVIQDGMLSLLRSGTLSVASATAFSLSPDAVAEFNDNAR
ncbi:MAG: propionyl-CoA--succinate CoA transferase, partial [Frankiales bacterium]|nr:propionyl-CoA--succinate CoA transferase [Frankiales bacterium]